MKKPSASHPRHALGGTLIGFVAGLLVGLGAALAVAVYVTKVPVPFVDRGLSRDAGADAKEAERNKGWNPNTAITGAPAPGAAPAAPPAAEGAIVVPPADGKALPPAPAAAAKPAAAPLPASQPPALFFWSCFSRTRNQLQPLQPLKPPCLRQVNSTPSTFSHGETRNARLRIHWKILC